MTNLDGGTVFDDIVLDHIEFYVASADDAAARFRTEFGLISGAEFAGPEARSVVAAAAGIRLVFTEARTDSHPAGAFVAVHGDGVGNIALRTADPVAAFTEAVSRGARPAGPPSAQGLAAPAIIGFGDVRHSFVAPPPDSNPAGQPVDAGATGLFAVDHLAICLEAGQLARTAEFYQTVLDFRRIFTERIVVGDQAMDSTVVQSRSGTATLTLIEPDAAMQPGQIDNFLKSHEGAGVQHIAFASKDIVASVAALESRGVGFLPAPDAYYSQLPQRLSPRAHHISDLRKHNVLVDEDHDGQLFQIFTRSTHPRDTFFVEIIERIGARSFGSGNIRALYEALSTEQLHRRQA